MLLRRDDEQQRGAGTDPVAVAFQVSRGGREVPAVSPRVLTQALLVLIRTTVEAGGLLVGELEESMDVVLLVEQELLNLFY